MPHFMEKGGEGARVVVTNEPLLAVPFNMREAGIKFRKNTPLRILPPGTPLVELHEVYAGRLASITPEWLTPWVTANTEDPSHYLVFWDGETGLYSEQEYWDDKVPIQ